MVCCVLIYSSCSLKQIYFEKLNECFLLSRLLTLEIWLVHSSICKFLFKIDSISWYTVWTSFCTFFLYIHNGFHKLHLVTTSYWLLCAKFMCFQHTSFFCHLWIPRQVNYYLCTMLFSRYKFFYCSVVLV